MFCHRFGVSNLSNCMVKHVLIGYESIMLTSERIGGIDFVGHDVIVELAVDGKA